MEAMTTIDHIPSSDLDLFSDEARLDPYPRYRALRAIGPVVHLRRHGVYAVPRFAEAREVLGNWKRYTSTQGTFLNPELNEQLGNLILLCMDPPEHTAVRRVFGRPLRPDRMRDLEPRLRAEANAVVERLVARREFDVVTELAEHLPMAVVSQLVGLGAHGRENMLRWARATWETQGVPNQRVRAAGPAVAEFIGFAMTEAVPGLLDPDGWAAQLYRAADAGEVAPDRCPFMMLDYVTPSLDTTIHAVSNAVRLFAEYPEQWTALRNDPTLMPHALNETLRLESPVQQFSRVVTVDHELAGARLTEGDRVLVLYGSANRDGRHYPAPERFDIHRRPSDHLAFGRGEHACVGLALARLELTVLFEALLDRVARFEVVTATPALSNALRGMERLVVRVEPITAKPDLT
jgi:cytochrome P450